MDPLVRWLIQRRLEDGRLPRGPITELQDSLGNGQPCDGCGTNIAKEQKSVSGIVMEDWRSIQLHRDCFEAWDVERSGRQGLRE